MSQKSILTIAGSDSISGAGIQQDIKIGQKLSTYVATAITAITVQDSKQIHYFQNLSENILQDQIIKIIDDLKIDFIKIGMISCPKQMQKISQIIPKNKKLIIDPIISSTANNNIISDNNLNYFKKYLLPRAFLLTPNLDEAQKIANQKIFNIKDMLKAGEIIQKFGACNVLIKGGHLPGKKIKHLLIEENGIKTIFHNKRIELNNDTHGTGCMLSTAISCFLTKDFSLKNAIVKANRFTYYKIKNCQKIGKNNNLILLS